MYAGLGKLQQRYRLLLCPTLPVPSLKAGESYAIRIEPRYVKIYQEHT